MMVRVNIEVSEYTREIWHAFAADREDYSSLTHLIKIAVEHEIKEKRGQRPRGRGSSTTTPDVQTDVINNRMEAMQDTIAELSDTVRDLELSSQADGLKQEHIKEMMHDAIGFLPVLDTEQTLEDLLGRNNVRQQNLSGRVTNKERAQQTGHPEDIAAALDAPMWEVEIALSRAVRDVPHIEAERINGTRHYYQEA
jgi:hypothetical protein